MLLRSRSPGRLLSGAAISHHPAEMQFLGAPHQMNHPHSLANPEKQGTKQRVAKNANMTA